jgi:hypothetical protein
MMSHVFSCPLNVFSKSGKYHLSLPFNFYEYNESEGDFDSNMERSILKVEQKISKYIPQLKIHKHRLQWRRKGRATRISLFNGLKSRTYENVRAELGWSILDSVQSMDKYRAGQLCIVATIDRGIQLKVKDYVAPSQNWGQGIDARWYFGKDSQLEDLSEVDETDVGDDADEEEGLVPPSGPSDPKEDGSDDEFDVMDGYGKEKGLAVKHLNKIKRRLMNDLEYMDPRTIGNFTHDDVPDDIALFNGTAILNSVGAVCYLSDRKRYGTCVAVGDTLALTANHILVDAKARGTEIYLHFNGTDYTLEGEVLAFPDFDIAMVFLSGPIGAKLLINWRPSFYPPSKNPRFEAFVAMGKFDTTDGKTLSPGALRAFDSKHVLYTIDAWPGDSGGPIVDSRGMLIALHRAGESTMCCHRYQTNIGVRLDLWLRSQFDFGLDTERERKYRQKFESMNVEFATN